MPTNNRTRAQKPSGRKSPGRKTRAKSRRSSPIRRKCTKLVSGKIQKVMREYNSGNSRYANRASVIAASYNMTRRDHPECERQLKLKTRQ